MKLTNILSFFKSGHKEEEPQRDSIFSGENWAEKVRKEIKEGRIKGFFIYGESGREIDFQQLVSKK